jgi:hypothetical protein
MPDESIEQNKADSAASEPTERRGESSGSSRSGEHRHGHRHRRRRRHKADKPTSKIALIAFAGLVIVLGCGLFFAFGSRAAHKIKSSVTRQMTAEGKKFVAFGRQTVIIMNPSEEDWAYTTVTVNGQYVAHCPEIPKGTQFEIWFKNLRGPKGEFDAKAEKVQSVKIEPEGKQPIEWTPPIE